MTIQEGNRRPEGLTDFTFRHYITLMCDDRTRWSAFEAKLSQNRDIFRSEFIRVNHIRNTVFHFKEQITQAMCHHLRSFRDRIRSGIRTNEDD